MKLSAWALLLTGAGLGLVWSGCAREPGELPPDMRTPVNLDDLTGGHCIKSCEPDYGSEPVDCYAAEYAYEFFPGGTSGGAGRRYNRRRAGYSAAIMAAQMAPVLEKVDPNRVEESGCV